MSKSIFPSDTRVRRILEPHAVELKQAAAEADDPADADIYAGLAALARGEDVPKDVARRVIQRAEDQ